MDESEMTLGRHWKGQRVKGWFVSEKLDGVRAYWDGSCAWTRDGNIIHLPPHLLNEMPSGMALDGEIWAGRGQFEAVRQAVQLGRWTGAERFIVFDSPSSFGSWPARMAHVADVLSFRAKHQRTVVAIGFEVITGWDHLEQAWERVRAQGGEGLMLRDPACAVYEKGRTNRLLKVKLPPSLRRGRLHARRPRAALAIA